MRNQRLAWLDARIAASSLMLAVSAMLSLPLSPAHACSAAQTNRYDSNINVGVTIGFSVVRAFRATYGFDLRFGRGPALGWLRLERHGFTYTRFAAGMKVFHPGTGAEIEAGVAFAGAHNEDNIDRAWGAHLAGGRWNPAAEAQVQGTIPFSGDRKNY